MPAGESIIVTNRGRPVLRLVPEIEDPRTLERMVSEGTVRPPAERGMPDVVPGRHTVPAQLWEISLVPSSDGRCSRTYRPRDDGWPGDIVLHPAFLVGLVVLVVNDHVLKDRVPGVMTGKLSDLAGLAIFPMLVVAVVEVAHWVGGRQKWRATAATFAASAVATVGGFAAIKTIGPAGDLYRTTLGWSQWLLSAGPRFLVGSDVGVPHRAELIADRSDLVAAPMVVVSLWIGSRLRGRRPDPIRTETGG